MQKANSLKHQNGLIQILTKQSTQQEKRSKISCSLTTTFISKYSLVQLMPLCPKKPEQSTLLDIVFAIGEIISSTKEVVSIAELKQKLPPNISKNKFRYALFYLQHNGRIEFTPRGIVSIFISKEKVVEILSKGRTWT